MTANVANYLTDLRNDLASFALDLSEQTISLAEKDAKNELRNILTTLAERSEEIALDNIWAIFSSHMESRAARASRGGWAPKGAIYSVDYFQWMETRMEIALLTNWSAYARITAGWRAHFRALDAA